jgi:dihydrofolate reductase
MRKLKLQVQTTIDGFVTGPNGKLDWMTRIMSDDLKKYVNNLTDSVDTILMGRKMVDGFVNYWEGVKPDDEQYSFARKMVEKPKIVFSKTIKTSNWNNTTVENGDLTDVVNTLKNQSGKDIIVYGGAEFNASLVQANLIDEYYLSVNPVAIGQGRSIFSRLNRKFELVLVDSIRFDCGKVLLKYIPKH